MPSIEADQVIIEHRTAEVRRRERSHEIIGKKLPAAALCVGLERLLSADDMPNLAQRSADHLIVKIERMSDAPLDYLKAQALRTAVETYIKERAVRQQQETAYREAIAADTLDEDEKKLAMGAHIFFLRTGQKNTQRIVAVRREAYFILWFESVDDSELFAETTTEEEKRAEDEEKRNKNFDVSMAWIKDELTARIQEAGSPDYDISFLSEQNTSKHRDRRMNWSGAYDRFELSDGASILCIIIKGLKTSNDKNDVIFLHERRHFINHFLLEVFAKFELTAKLSDRFPNLNKAEKEAGSHHIGVTREYIYDYLLEPFSAPQLAELEELLAEIKTALAEATIIFKDSDDSTLLINMLTDVPLTRFPEWIRAITEYFKIELQKIIPPQMDKLYDTIVEMQIIQRSPKGLLYPASITDVPVGRLREDSLIVLELYDKARKILLENLAIEPFEKARMLLSIQEKSNTIFKPYKALLRDGIPVPAAFRAVVMNHGPDESLSAELCDLVDRETTPLVLGKLAAYPAEFLQKIYVLGGNSDDKNDPFYKLNEEIKSWLVNAPGDSHKIIISVIADCPYLNINIYTNFHHENGPSDMIVSSIRCFVR